MTIADDPLINSSASGYTGKTYTIVIKTGTDVTDRQIVYEEGGLYNGFNTYIHNGKLWTSTYDDDGAIGGSISNFTVQPNTVYMITYNFSFLAGSGREGWFNIYINGTSYGTENFFSSNNLGQHLGNIGLGGRVEDTRYVNNGGAAAGNGDYFKGMIGAIVYYNRYITQTERYTVEQALATKWGITIDRAPQGCTAEGYLTVDGIDNSKLYRLQIVGSTASIIPVGNGVAFPYYLNALGYNYQDGFFYGLTSNNSQLLRVNKLGFGEIVGIPKNGATYLPIQQSSGTMDENGTLFTYNNPNLCCSNVQMNKIDIANADFPTIQYTNITTSSTTGQSGQFSELTGDWAYNPTDGFLYSPGETYLRRTDPATGVTSGVTFSNGVVPGSETVGKVWIDQYGDFYMMRNGGSIYKVSDITTATPFWALVSTGPTSTGDAASCPNGAAVRKSVLPSPVSAGSEVTYTFEVFNSSKDPLTNLTFSDVFSDTRTWKVNTLALNGSPTNSPLGGTANTYGGTNTLTISGISLTAKSKNTITVKAQIPANFPASTVTNQASLSGLSVNHAITGTILSDQPGGGYNEPTVLTVTASTLDTDGDGIPDATDQDDDNDGIPDSTEGTGDTDGDGVPDSLDYDSDNDGINDVIEAGGTDANGDGKQDGTANPTTGQIGAGLTPPNSDNDAIPNYKDLDSDNDAVSDLQESGSNGTDADNDGVVDGPDTDGDGIPDSVDGLVGPGDAGSPALPNADNDALPDYRDPDSDNDGTYDIVEKANKGSLDANNDGMVDSPTDPDGDGIPNNGGLDTKPAAFGGLPTATGPAAVDLFPNFTFGGSSFTLNATKTIVININEIKGAATSGIIQVFVPAATGFTYNFNGTAASVTVIGSETVNNADWTMTSSPTGLLFSTKAGVSIPANGRSRIALSITANTAGTDGTLTANVTPVVGETNAYNNIAVVGISIQN